MTDELEKAIDNLHAIKENLKDFKGEKLITFQRSKERNHWTNVLQTSVWRVLLDENMSKWCVKDSITFKIVDKNIGDETVVAPIGMRDLILSKNKEDRELGRLALNKIADKKYGRTEKQS